MAPPPRLTVATAVLMMALVSTARGAGDKPGVLWETTSETEMEGMPMKLPARTTKLCAAKEWDRAPAGDPHCTNSNFKKVGSKATWTSQCTGEMAMTGVGEMTFNGDDSYTGTIKFASEQMNMTVKLAGRKIGDCENPQ